MMIIKKKKKETIAAKKLNLTAVSFHGVKFKNLTLNLKSFENNENVI